MKNVTRFVSILAICMAIVCSSLCVYADTAASSITIAEQLIDQEKERNSDYFIQIDEIMSALENQVLGSNSLYTAGGQVETDTIASYNIDNAYKVNVLEPLFLTILEETGSFEAAITETIQWKVPITTQTGETGLAVLSETDGELTFVGMTIGNMASTWSVTDSDILNAVKAYGDLDNSTDSLQIAHSYLYNTTFVYLSGGETSYLVPFSSYAGEIGIDNGMVYTVAELQEIFNECFDESIITNNPSYNGGAPFRSKTVIPLGSIALAVIPFVLILSIVFILQRNKKKRYI